MTKGMKAYNQGVNLRRITYQRMAMLSKKNIRGIQVD
ncbi:MAG: hypothetical protein ACI88L_000136 [Candidatus Paceibacteria bacterium]|jgi:hypothetical protein